MHQVRRMTNGERELCSRFWIRYGQSQNGHDLAVHCHQEMTRQYMLRKNFPSKLELTYDFKPWLVLAKSL